MDISEKINKNQNILSLVHDFFFYGKIKTILIYFNIADFLKINNEFENGTA